MGGWRNRTTAYRNLIERQEMDAGFKDAEIYKKFGFKTDSPNLNHGQQNGIPYQDFDGYRHFNRKEGKRIKVPSITLNDGEAFQYQSEFNHSRSNKRPSGTKIPSKFIRQRSRSAGPSRNMRLSHIGQV